MQALGGEYRIGVIEGDLETENDAERLRRLGIEAVQITTGTACHLDAHMVHNALHDLNLSRFDILFIENVGNLVCPASFDLGQHLNVALLSVTEGDDKPAKYPVLFRTADNIVISKGDLLRYLDDFSPEACRNRDPATWPPRSPSSPSRPRAAPDSTSGSTGSTARLTNSWNGWYWARP